MHFNYLIKNGTVVDGTGSKPIKSDVGIKNQTIEVVGDLSTSVADNVLDAAGMIVSPGFIDVHSHADGALLVDGQHASGIKQVRLGKMTCTGGTDVRYKAVWANQSEGSLETRLHAIGINY